MLYSHTMNVLRSLRHRPFAMGRANSDFDRLHVPERDLHVRLCADLDSHASGNGARPKVRRVYSIDALGSFVLLPIGFSLSGWATDRFGAPNVFLIGGPGTITLAFAGLLRPAIHKLD